MLTEGLKYLQDRDTMTQSTAVSVSKQIHESHP